VAVFAFTRFTVLLLISIIPSAMPDQAYDLRRLAMHRMHRKSANAGRPARLVVMGGKGGVGTTTVGLNLAIATAEAGKSTMFVDADPCGGDAALLCGIEERHTLADILASRRNWEEATHLGPSGVRIVVGRRGWPDSIGSPTAAAEQLCESLEHQNSRTDLVVIDVGNTLNEVVPHLCLRADAVLLVVASDAVSVVKTFAAVKMLIASARNVDNHIGELTGSLHLLVNMAPTVAAAERVRDRLTLACRRLLGFNLKSAGQVTLVGATTKNRLYEQIRLNIEPSLSDTARGLFSAKSLLKWQRRGEFKERLLEQSPTC